MKEESAIQAVTPEVIKSRMEQRVSGILCVRHSMRSDYAQTTEDPAGQL
jgi:hypothetical protein